MATLREYWSTGGDGLAFSYSVAQTFTASTDYSLEKIGVRLAYGYGVPESGDFSLNIYLYDVDGNQKPNNQLAQFGSIVKSSLTLTFGWKYFTDTTYPLSNGVRYAIVISVVNKTGTVFPRADGRSGYADQIGWTQFSEGVWSDSGRDWNFRTYGDPVVRQIDTPTPSDTSTGIVLVPRLQWKIDGASETEEGDSFDVYLKANDFNFGPDNLLRNVTDLDVQIIAGLTYNTLYYWQVVPFSTGGNLLGDDAWSFTTILFLPPAPSVDGGGNPTGINNMITVKRLVAAADNKIFYET